MKLFVEAIFTLSMLCSTRVESSGIDVETFTCQSEYPMEVETLNLDCDYDCADGENATISIAIGHDDMEMAEDVYLTAEIINKSGQTKALVNSESIDLGCDVNSYNDSSTNATMCSYDYDSVLEFDYTIGSSSFMSWNSTGNLFYAHVKFYDTYLGLIGDCIAPVNNNQAADTSNFYNTTDIADGLNSQYETYRDVMMEAIHDYPVAAYASGVLVLALAAAGFVSCKSKPPADTENDKKVELLSEEDKQAIEMQQIENLNVPDEIERNRSTFKEKIPWPKTRKTRHHDYSSESDIEE